MARIVQTRLAETDALVRGLREARRLQRQLGGPPVAGGGAGGGGASPGSSGRRFDPSGARLTSNVNRLLGLMESNDPFFDIGSRPMR